MNLVFESITLKRFRSFLEETSLHFSSAGHGLYFLKGKNHVQKSLGSNGSGKSSLLDALMWCLYGKTVQGLKNPDVVPWIGKGTTEVSVVLLVDKKRHTVKRTINPNLLTIDGQEAGQEYVDALVAIPLEVLPYTVIMGQRQPLFFDLTASEKLKIFSEPLNLERWETRSQHAAELVRSLELTLATKEQETTLLHANVCQIDVDIESLKKKKTEWETKREEVLDTKASEKKKLEKVLVPLHKERDDADLKLDRAETEIRAIDIRKLQRAERDAATKLGNLDSDIQNARDQEYQLREWIKQITDQKCPTCEQPIKTAKTREQLVKNIEGQIAALDMEKLISDRDNAFKLHEVALLALQKQEEAEKVFIKDADDARDALDKLNPRIAQIEAAVGLAQALIEKYENEDNPFKNQVVDLRKRKSDTESRIEFVTKDLEEKKEHCERVRPWIKWFKDIKLYTLEEILQELQITTNSLLEEFGLAGWSVVYDIERETKSKTIARGLNITVHSPSNAKPVKWESWSGGEAQRLRIIGSIALGSVLLNHLGVTTNLAVFDEPTESLSKEGVVDLVELLANYAKDTNRDVWLVDHHTVESSHFKEVIEVHKDKQGSFISQ